MLKPNMLQNLGEVDAGMIITDIYIHSVTLIFCYFSMLIFISISIPLDLIESNLFKDFKQWNNIQVNAYLNLGLEVTLSHN